MERTSVVLRPHWLLTAALSLIAGFLGMLALKPYVATTPVVRAADSRFDHIYIASTQFLYKGMRGLLVMDKRNASVWFFEYRENGFKDPVLITRIPFEKLDTFLNAQ